MTEKSAEHVEFLSLDETTCRFHSIVNARVLQRFRQAVMILHGSQYSYMSLEANRALSIHADRMFAEAAVMREQPKMEMGAETDEKKYATQNVFGGGDEESKDGDPVPY